MPFYAKEPSLGVKAKSYTGGQVRVLTDSAFTKARILKIDEENIRRDLAAGCPFSDRLEGFVPALRVRGTEVKRFVLCHDEARFKSGCAFLSITSIIGILFYKVNR